MGLMSYFLNGFFLGTATVAAAGALPDFSAKYALTSSSVGAALAPSALYEGLVVASIARTLASCSPNLTDLSSSD